MKKWLIAGITYLLVVIGGYSIYANVIVKDDLSSQEQQHNSDEPHEHESSDDSISADHGEHGDTVNHEVMVLAKADDKEVTIELTDQDGNPVTELEINHEKLIHLIIVEGHLEQYFHLHPEEVEKGVFQANHDLKEGNYKAFVDIKPKNLEYDIQPISFTVGELQEEHSHDMLETDTELTKVVNGEQVTLNLSSASVGEPVIMDFEMNEDNLEPYLGAMGHVVILDEEAENYIHVHPKNDVDPIFETEFKSSGTYKIWAEFKFDGVVNIYPFIIEIK